MIFLFCFVFGDLRVLALKLASPAVWPPNASLYPSSTFACDYSRVVRLARTLKLKLVLIVDYSLTDDDGASVFYVCLVSSEAHGSSYVIYTLPNIH